MWKTLGAEILAQQPLDERRHRLRYFPGLNAGDLRAGLVDQELVEVPLHIGAAVGIGGGVVGTGDNFGN